MTQWRSTSSKWWLIFWAIFWLLFAVLWSILLYDQIKSWNPEWALLWMIWVWWLAFIICIKWYIKLLKKKKVKKNKELMKRVDAKVTSFEPWDTETRTRTQLSIRDNSVTKPTSYYFNASDWFETYSSEEFHADVKWECWDISEPLKLMQIPYNPEKPEDTIKALNDRLNQINIELQQNSWPKVLLLKTAYASTQKMKERLESWEIPYMEFKWHKLSVGDKVSVYVDPEDPKNYRIDTEFLYQ